MSEGLVLFVPVTVTLELEWMLRSGYRFDKEETIAALAELFSAAELTFQSEIALEVALHLYRTGSADFADCLHVSMAAQAAESPLWTFDKAAATLGGARLIAS